MKVELSREQEKIVEDELKTGQFRTPEEVVGEALQVLHQKTHHFSKAGKSGYGRQLEAVQAMVEFVEANRVRLKDISVKDLIREGHRL